MKQWIEAWRGAWKRNGGSQGVRAFVRAVALGLGLMVTVGACSDDGKKELAYSELKQRIASGRVESVEISSGSIEAVPTEAARTAGAPERWTTVPVPNDEGLTALLDEHSITYSAESNEGPNPLLVLSLLIVGIAVVLVLVPMLQRRIAQNGSGFSRFRPRDATEEDLGVDFDDVAGVDEAKEELEEVVKFLKSPDRFARLGAKIPKGVLLVGPPGTGKTLLARAVAGEAGVPFFSISGSEFVEMYVGVGASRVRKLFGRAKDEAPCIVFIDELDAAGKRRGGSAVARNDEHEQTVNQLLVAMDGFEPQSGIIVMAATNRPEILDPALLRPGRFDRQVSVGRPDRRGREAILRVHARGVRLADDVDLTEVAKRTPGFVGADLANLLNEAALLAARGERARVGMAEVDAAIDRVVAGLEKKNGLVHDKERRIVAYHEAGHGIVAERVDMAEPVKKISIIPRSIGALGNTQQIPAERQLLQEDELLDRLAVLLGGRAAERIIFGKVSTGASNDLERATDIARRMICEYGMSETLGPIAYSREDSPMLQTSGEGTGGRCSEITAREIDKEVQTLVTGAFRRACEVLREDRDALEGVARHLLEHEVMERDTLLDALKRTPAA